MRRDKMGFDNKKLRNVIALVKNNGKTIKAGEAQ
jgi:uncharacterized protein (UPF0335 family)